MTKELSTGAGTPSPSGTQVAYEPRGTEGVGKFVRDVLFANLPLPFQKLRTYLWLFFFSRLLGPSGFGVWSLFQTTLSLGVVLTSMTQGNALIRFLSGDRTEEEKNSAFSSIFTAVSVSSLLIALLVAAFSGTLSDLLFHDRQGIAVLMLVAALLPLETTFELMRGFLRARRLNRSWAFFTLIRQMPEMMILIGIAWWAQRPIPVVAGYLVTAASAVAFGFVYLIVGQGVRFTVPSWSLLSKYVPYGLALVPGALASLLSFAADKYLVGHYLNLQDVGIYSACFTISALGFFFVGPLNDVLMPEMAVLYDAGDWELFYRRFSGVQRFVVAIAGGAMAILLAFPNQLLRLVGTQAFVSGAQSLAVLGLQGVFMSVVMLYIVILYIRFKLFWTALIWGGMGVLILTGDVILLPRLGILGAALSQVVSSMAGAAVIIVCNWKLFRHTFRPVWIAQIGAALFVVLIFSRVWRGSNFSAERSVAQILAGLLCFAAVLFSTRYFNVAEFRTLRRALSRAEI